MRKILYIGLLILSVGFFSGCNHENIDLPSPEGDTYLLLEGVSSRVLEGNGTHPGDAADSEVRTLRVLAFERTGSKLCKVNELHYAYPESKISQKIDNGTYDIVVIANEPLDAATQAALAGITPGTGKYSDLDNIAFPASAFNDDLNIPMIQEKPNVEVLPGSQGVKDNGSAVQTALRVNLKRLGARLDVLLNSTFDLTNGFDGVVLTNVPNVVPITSNYTGTVTRTGEKTVGKTEFATETPSGTATWSKKRARIILPANEFPDFQSDTKAIELTVKMVDGSYSPSCKLRITSASDPVAGAVNNYTLPKNTKLDFRAKISYPLEVNIKASDWDGESHNWNIEKQRILNVSHTSVSMTDYNGVRISFWSNMPVVKR